VVQRGTNVRFAIERSRVQIPPSPFLAKLCERPGSFSWFLITLITLDSDFEKIWNDDATKKWNNNQYQFYVGLRNSLAISLFNIKFEVQGRDEALSYILKPFGIKMILIEPGVTNTKFVQDIVVSTNKYEDDKNEDRIN
jgi:hypothetical protein